MNKISIKLNKFFKKINKISIMISLPLVIIGIVSEKVLQNDFLQTISFIVVTLLCGLPILHKALMALSAKLVSIETLVSIAVIGSLFIGELSEGAIVTFLFQLGAYLELITLHKTRNAIKMLVQMAPDTALRMTSDNEYEEIDADEVEIGDLLQVRVGGKVAVDGIVVSGQGYLDQSNITGESFPVKKEAGEKVYGGTILDSGLIIMKATSQYDDSTFAKIIDLVQEAQDGKSEIEKFIDRFAKVYTPFVIVLAFIVLIIGKSINTAITVLVLACPGALVIGVPVANVAGIGKGARNHILLKGGQAITNYGKSDVFVFDKTGTLTNGKPIVSDATYYDENEKVLEMAIKMEYYSDHPLAKAIVNYALDNNIKVKEYYKVETIKGQGVVCSCDNKQMLMGNEKLLVSNGITNIETDKIEEYKQKGYSIVLLAYDGKLRAIFGLRDEIKPGCKEALARIRKSKVKKLVMLSGDNQKTADIIGKELGFDEVIGNMLPIDKMEYVRELQNKGYKVAFVGDGINDSPALTLADSGIAIGSGTDVAIETSDIVLIKSDLESLYKSFVLAKKTLKVMNQNILIALATVVILLVGLVMGKVSMAIGMFVHEASILAVIFNALALLKIKL